MDCDSKIVNGGAEQNLDRDTNYTECFPQEILWYYLKTGHGHSFQILPNWSFVTIILFLIQCHVISAVGQALLNKTSKYDAGWQRISAA
jgi:hypothetical protein